MEKKLRFDHTETFKQHSAFIEAIRDQNEFGTVLITASHIDNMLERILKAFFVRGRSTKPLFEAANAPLGTFSAKTHMAYGLGLISTQERSSINAIRAVRNAFAHRVRASIRDAEIAVEVKPLLWAAFRNELGDVDPFEIFYLAAMRLSIALLNRADHVERSRLREREWPLVRIDMNLYDDFDPFDRD